MKNSSKLFLTFTSLETSDCPAFMLSVVELALGELDLLGYFLNYFHKLHDDHTTIRLNLSSDVAARNVLVSLLTFLTPGSSTEITEAFHKGVPLLTGFTPIPIDGLLFGSQTKTSLMTVERTEVRPLSSQLVTVNALRRRRDCLTPC